MDILKQVQDKLTAGAVNDIIPTWALTPEQVGALADALMEHTRAVYDKIAAAKDEATFANTCGEMSKNDILFHVVDSMCTFPQFVSADKKLRDACTEAEEKLSQFGVEMNSRYDVYHAFKAYADKNEKLEGEKQRYIERVMRNYRRKGLHLAEDVRDKVKELNKKISSLCIKFEKNINDENTKLTFSREELDGLADDFIDNLDKDGDKFVLTLQYPHYVPVSKMCKVSSTRKAMATAFDSRCVKENTPILEELVTLRNDLAQTLGYATHAAYITEIRMAESPEKVAKFLNELNERLTPLQEKEMAALLELKNKEEGDSSDDKLNLWDISYYRNKVEKEHYKVDHEKLKQYFPLERVTKGLLDIYQELFGLKMTEVEGPRWHDEAKLFEVTDADTGAKIGYFYIDLHPRDGKYSHAACFGLQPSCSLGDGRLVPVAALVCNFPKPTKDKPALLTHNDVETFFHEFGHGMHQLLSKADFSMFAGTSVERDFVEAPSQMLENWVWDRQALHRMSGHVDDGSPIPDDLLDSLISSRKANAGILNKRQLLFALFDQKIHTSAQADTQAEYAKMMESIYRVPHVEGTSMPASFGHLAGGYDAQYYGYLWSEVFAMDLFESRFRKEGIFNPAVGKEYREKVLACGGSVDAADMIRSFLGREPTQDAFLRSKGL